MENMNTLLRVRSLQRLCSDSDPRSPRALLFVCGADGRNNKGSINSLKYLFRGATGKDLFDDALEQHLEELEEIVLLVKRTSLCVLWNHRIKQLLAPCFYGIPHLIEYITDTTEEKDIDLMQARKCCDFKRMVLETLNEGDGVGIPVPIGYDNIQDVESWPILQSFAMDAVYCPTGFFTSNYKVADITEHIELLFRTVDGHFVDSALRLMHKTIRPHMLQSIASLRASTAEQRMAVTAEDVVGPLDVLFEFGEMEACAAVDPATKPIVLFGADTKEFSAGTATAMASTVSGASKSQQNQPAWLHRSVGDASLHTIIEACEPSTGLRWCRTYFLQRAEALPLLIADVPMPSARISNSNEEGDGEDNEEQVNANANAAAAAAMASFSVFRSMNKAVSAAAAGEAAAAASTTTTRTAAFDSLRRLELLYAKLWLGLRLVVRNAFANQSDVLEAGTVVQQQLDAMMKGQKSLGKWAAFLDGVVLRPNERLQVHMDCMNALGELVTIEDVDDMGGSCWTYIRVSVHGIAVTRPSSAAYAVTGITDLVTVAVGDTFLFSAGNSLSSSTTTSLTSVVANSIQFKDQVAENAAHLLTAHLSDFFCVTHTLPYYCNTLGGGMEDRAAHTLLTSSRNFHLLPLLGLGKPMDTLGTGLLSGVTLLTDHPLVSVCTEANLRVFGGGLIVEQTEITSAPMLISIGTHVECAWIVSSTECMDQATRRLLPFLQNTEFIIPAAPQGMLVVFRIKEFNKHQQKQQPSVGKRANEGDNEDDDDNPFTREGRSIQFAFNTLNFALPHLQDNNDCRHLAIFIRSDSRASAAFTTSISTWRDALRLHDVPEHKGGTVPLPESILASYLSAVDRMCYEDEVVATVSSTTTTAAAISASNAVFLTEFNRENVNLPLPGVGGIHAMRCLHNVAVAQRLLPTATNANNNSTINNNVANAKQREMIVLSGHAGCGVGIISAFFASQLSARVAGESRFAHVIVDLAELAPASTDQDSFAKLLDRSLSRCVQYDANSNVGMIILVSLTLNSAIRVCFAEALAALRAQLHCRIAAVVSVVSPLALRLDDTVFSNYANLPFERSHFGVGHEFWQANGLEQLHAPHCDFVVAVEEQSSSAAYQGFRRYMAAVNSEATIVRQTPLNMRFDEDTMEAICSTILQLNSRNSSSNSKTREDIRKRIARESAYGWTFATNNLGHEQQQQQRQQQGGGGGGRGKLTQCVVSLTCSAPKAVACLQSIRFTPPSGKLWNIENISKTLQLLFPKARLYSTSLDEIWSIPDNNGNSNGSTGGSSSSNGETNDFQTPGVLFQRLIHIAQTKVVSACRLRQDARIFAETASQLLTSTSTPAAVNHVFAVHGVVSESSGITFSSTAGINSSENAQQQQQQRQTLTKRNARQLQVEACSNAVVMRDVHSNVKSKNDGSSSSNNSSNNNNNWLVVEGVFDDKDVTLLSNLFDACVQHQLQPKKKLTLEDVGVAEKLKIQNQSKYKKQCELPGGVWYDGLEYMDIHGTKTILRPDIDRLVDLYVHDENRKIEEYNQMIARTSASH